MAKELHIRIDTIIGVLEDSYGFIYPGFTALELEWRLMELPNPEKLILHMGTEGGDVWEGLKIYNKLIELREAGTIIEVIVESICYSMGTVIAMAASPGRLFARKSSLWCPHKPMSVPRYAMNADELRKEAAELDSHESVLIAAYNRTGKELLIIQEELRKDAIISADEAKEAGWIDDVINAPALVQNSKATALKPIAFLSAKKQDNTPAPINSNQNNTVMAEKKNPSKWDKFINLITNLAAEVEDENAPVATEKTLKAGGSIYYEGELAVDTAVFSDPEMTTALADSDYELEDGQTITVAGGVVTAIAEAAEESAEALALREANDTIASLQTELEGYKAKETEITNLKTQVTNLNKQVTDLKKLVPGGGDKTKTPAQNFKGDEKNTGAHPLDKAAAKIKSQKK